MHEGLLAADLEHLGLGGFALGRLEVCSSLCAGRSWVYPSE
ncbi:MAG: hypothetical protein R3F62_09900 [Planctomycetota bacterium]